MINSKDDRVEFDIPYMPFFNLSKEAYLAFLEKLIEDSEGKPEAKSLQRLRKAKAINLFPVPKLFFTNAQLKVNWLAPNGVYTVSVLDPGAAERVRSKGRWARHAMSTHIPGRVSEAEYEEFGASRKALGNFDALTNLVKRQLAKAIDKADPI